MEGLKSRASQLHSAAYQKTFWQSATEVELNLPPCAVLPPASCRSSDSPLRSMTGEHGDHLLLSDRLVVDNRPLTVGHVTLRKTSPLA